MIVKDSTANQIHNNSTKYIYLYIYYKIKIKCFRVSY